MLCEEVALIPRALCRSARRRKNVDVECTFWSSRCTARELLQPTLRTEDMNVRPLLLLSLELIEAIGTASKQHAPRNCRCVPTERAEQKGFELQSKRLVIPETVRALLDVFVVA